MRPIFRTKDLCSILCAFVFLLFLASCSKNQTTKPNTFQKEDALEVKTIEGSRYIAIAAPLTGPYKELGNTILEGATIAVEEYNSKQNKAENKIGTIIIDDGGMVSEGLARTDLVLAQKALGVVGHLNSEISVETSAIYSKNKIATISPASTNPIYTERPNLKGYVFRTIGSDRQLAKAAYQYISSDPSIKKVAILFNDRVYGKSVAEQFGKKVIKNKKLEIVVSKTIPVRTTNHEQTASEVAALKPDLVFFIGEYNDAAYLVKALKQKIPNIKFLGAEGVHQQEFINIAGAYAEDAMVIGSGTGSQELAQIYEKRFKKPISGYVESSYEATKILIDAIEKSNFSSSPQIIAGVVAKNKIFNPNGDLLRPDFVIYQVKSGKFSTLKNLEFGKPAIAK